MFSSVSVFVAQRGDRQAVKIEGVMGVAVMTANMNVPVSFAGGTAVFPFFDMTSASKQAFIFK